MKKLYFSFARFALLEIFNIINLKKDDKILLPSFICRDLLSPIYSKGAIPVFYDVNKELNPILLPRNKNIKAVIAVNYFGFPQNLKIFKDYCKKNKCILIEDNAHGYLSRDENNIPLGERGDFGIYSFRKTISISEIGMLSINNSIFINNKNIQIPFSKSNIRLKFKIKIFLIKLQILTKINFVSYGENFIRFFKLILYGNFISPSNPNEEFLIPKNPTPKIKSFDYLKSINKKEEIKRRVYLFNFFKKKLKHYDIRPIFDKIPLNTCPKGYPFISDIKTANKIKNLARKSKGFNCISWPNLPSNQKKYDRFYSKVYLINFAY
ncbi:MAG: hypothetical protein CMJ05_02760 [Pelagibacterales bacterium]|nr:hypothetical protein [Pelagibacterales bacterium]|tara:strand:- start:13710 stop:14678 length:969 start_codon:yes stop_codon:yes gene_type:complete